MADFQSLRRKQTLREAEGYLDLAVAGGELMELTEGLRNRLAQRALQVLALNRSSGSHHVEMAYLRGQALRMLSRHQEAIHHLAEAAELDPDNIHVWLALGWCYKRVGRLDLAIESLERAMEADNKQAIIYYNLACYWSLATNVKLALAYLTRAFDLDPAYRDLVANESDFDAIRKDPRFQELTNTAVRSGGCQP
jgi:Flp pilus assembly protein TadD